MKKAKKVLLLIGVSLILAACSSSSGKKNCGTDGVCAIGDEKKLIVNVPPTLLD